MSPCWKSIPACRQERVSIYFSVFFICRSEETLNHPAVTSFISDWGHITPIFRFVFWFRIYWICQTVSRTDKHETSLSRSVSYSSFIKMFLFMIRCYLSGFPVFFGNTAEQRELQCASRSKLKHIARLFSGTPHSVLQMFSLHRDDTKTNLSTTSTQTQVSCRSVILMKTHFNDLSVSFTFSHMIRWKSINVC